MPSGTRKGFKFTSKGSKVSESEFINFDEVEAEATTTPSKLQAAGGNRENKTEANIGEASESPSKKQRTSSATAPPSATVQANSSKQKAHYPQVVFDSEKITRSILASKTATSHKSKLHALVKSICDAERASLERYFNAHKGREDLYQTLLNVLENLPGDIENSCSEDVVFLVENKRAHSGDTKRLESIRVHLQQQSEKLVALDVKLGGLNEVIDSALSATNEESSSTVGSGDAKTINSRYDSLLQTMEKHCEALIKETNNIAAIAASSSISHQKLYDAYQKVRFDSTGHPVPRRTQDLMRGLSKM